MNIEITARHFTASDKLKKMINEKIMKIEKFNSDIISYRVVLTKESHFEDVEIIINRKGNNFVSHEYGDTFEKALISAVDKITIQVKKQHDRIVSH